MGEEQRERENKWRAREEEEKRRRRQEEEMGTRGAQKSRDKRGEEPSAGKVKERRRGEEGRRREPTPSSQLCASSRAVTHQALR